MYKVNNFSLWLSFSSQPWKHFVSSFGHSIYPHTLCHSIHFNVNLSREVYSRAVNMLVFFRIANLWVEQGKEQLNRPLDSCSLISLFDFCVHRLDLSLPKLASSLSMWHQKAVQKAGGSVLQNAGVPGRCAGILQLCMSRKGEHQVVFRELNKVIWTRMPVKWVQVITLDREFDYSIWSAYLSRNSEICLRGQNWHQPTSVIPEEQLMSIMWDMAP